VIQKTGMALTIFALVLGLAGHSSAKNSAASKAKGCYMGKYKGDKVVKTDAEWKKALKPEAFEVLRHEGTERAFTGAYWNNHEKGHYVCAGCGLELFTSDTKFESGTGWPSFYQPIFAENVASTTDSTLGMVRTEVHCPRCGGHLGHVFDDGPQPTGLRYCINSVSVSFVPEKKDKK
jgi:peptide-methionine (R)-S-oxide reductase